MYRLIFQEGPLKGKRLTVQQGSVVIGRDPDSHIHIPDDEISWRHAAIEQRDDGVYIRDMGSLNKIIVNGTDVKEARLNNADNISIGQSTFTYTKIQPVVNEQARKVNYVQRITFMAVITILVVQFVFLLALGIWRFGVVKADMRLPGGEVDPDAVALAAPRQEEKEKAPHKPAAPTPKAPREQKKAVESTPTPTPEPTKTPAPKKAEPTPTPEPIPVIPKITIANKNTTTTEKTSATPTPTPKKVVAQPKAEKKSKGPHTLEPPAKQPLMKTDADDPLMEIAKEMMEEATLEIKKHNYVQADQQLERVQIVCPDYFPAYAERAKLYEQRGLLTEAGEEWGDLLQKTTGTTWHKYAADERARVARAEMLKKNIKAPVVKKANKKKISGKLPENIRIDAVKRQTFNKTREYDKMRMLTITVRQAIDTMDIDGEAVQLNVSFYDKIKGTGQVVPTQVVVPDEAITFEGRWPPDERRTTTAAYIVPTGFRAIEKIDFGVARAYYGYVVEVYYDGILQDRAARPKKLLELIE